MFRNVDLKCPAMTSSYHQVVCGDSMSTVKYPSSELSVVTVCGLSSYRSSELSVVTVCGLSSYRSSELSEVTVCGLPITAVVSCLW